MRELFLLQLVELPPQVLDCGLFEHRRDRHRRRGRRPGSAPQAFLLDAVDARLGRGVVELRESRDDDVLVAVERAGVLRFLVLRRAPGRSCCTSAACFCTSPVSQSALFSSDSTLSRRLCATYSSANALAARAANCGSAESNVMSTSWLPRTWLTLNRPSSASAIVRCVRPRSSASAAASGWRLRRRDQAVRPRRVVLDQRDADGASCVGFGPCPLNSGTLVRSSFGARAREVAAPHDAQLRLHVDLGIGERDAARDFGRRGDVGVRIFDQHARVARDTPGCAV